MRRNYVKKIVIHISHEHSLSSLADKVSQFHGDVIERRLNASNLPTQQKIMVIDQILEKVKLREQTRIIK